MSCLESQHLILLWFCLELFLVKSKLHNATVNIVSKMFITPVILKYCLITANINNSTLTCVIMLKDIMLTTENNPALEHSNNSSKVFLLLFYISRVPLRCLREMRKGKLHFQRASSTDCIFFWLKYSFVSKFMRSFICEYAIHVSKLLLGENLKKSKCCRSSKQCSFILHE